MLTKVIKYEMRAMGRLLLPFFGLAVAFSAVLRLGLFIAPLIWTPASVALSSMAVLGGVLLVVAILVLTFAYGVVRFYQGMVGPEGYLSFTLPVKTGAHILGRLAAATVYSFASVFVAFICALIFIPGFAAFLGNAPATLVNNAAVSWGSLGFGFILSLIGLLIFYAFTAAVSNFAPIYLSMAIAPKISRNRIAGTVVGYFLISTVQSLLSIPFVFISFAMGFGNTDATVNALRPLAALTANGNYTAAAHWLLGLLWVAALVTGIVSLLFVAGQLLLTRYFFAKKLNLE